MHRHSRADGPGLCAHIACIVAATLCVCVGGGIVLAVAGKVTNTCIVMNLNPLQAVDGHGRRLYHSISVSVLYIMVSMWWNLRIHFSLVLALCLPQGCTVLK